VIINLTNTPLSIHKLVDDYRVTCW